jgi:uncharacterized membrane protein required for colicin V production
MFNFFDVIVSIIMLACGYFGFNTGIIASVFYVLSGFAGMWAAQKFSAQLNMDFYLVFGIVALAVILTGFFTGKILKALFLGTIDRIVGAVLGMCLGLVIAALVVFPATKNISPKWRNIMQSSYTEKKVMVQFRKVFPEIRELRLEQIAQTLPEITIPDKINLELHVPDKLKQEAKKAEEKIKSAVSAQKSKKPGEKK